MAITASKLWEKYPHYTTENQKEGGGLYPNGKSSSDAWQMAGANLYDNYKTENSCAVRLSIALHNCIGNFDPHDDWTHQNNATDMRYIISAAYMQQFLKTHLGPSDGVLATHDDAALKALQTKLKPDKIAIACSDGHAAIIKWDYADKYVPYGNMDYWLFD